jgi:hypothetical protein
MRFPFLFPFAASRLRVSLGLFLSAASLCAAPPAWWTATNPMNTSIITPGATPNPLGPVNQGQLKNVAKKAALYLDQTLPAPGAGPEIQALVAGFSHDAAATFQPVNLGQLKAVAKPFYVRLQQVGFDTKQSLRSHGVPDWAYSFPWNTTNPIPTEDNYAPANIGQLKWVFSFEIPPPLTLNIQLNSGVQWVELSWNSATNSAQYIIERRTGDGEWEVLKLVSGSTTFIDYHPPSAANLTYRVRDANNPNLVFSENRSVETLPDSDNDGLPDSSELGDLFVGAPNTYPTSPDNPDSDDDGSFDGDEVIQGSDPKLQRTAGIGFPEGALDGDKIYLLVSSTSKEVTQQGFQPFNAGYGDNSVLFKSKQIDKNSSLASYQLQGNSGIFTPYSTVVNTVDTYNDPITIFYPPENTSWISTPILGPTQFTFSDSNFDVSVTGAYGDLPDAKGTIQSSSTDKRTWLDLEKNNYYLSPSQISLSNPNRRPVAVVGYTPYSYYWVFRTQACTYTAVLGAPSYFVDIWSNLKNQGISESFEPANGVTSSLEYSSVTSGSPWCPQLGYHLWLPDLRFNHLQLTKARVKLRLGKARDRLYALPINISFYVSGAPSIPPSEKTISINGLESDPFEIDASAYVPMTSGIPNFAQAGGFNPTCMISAYLNLDPTLLIPFDLISDLNNDEKVGDADRTLKANGSKTGATDIDKEKATEYLFSNDTLSNGAWDKEDKDPLKPQDKKDDDDAEEIDLVCAATWGAVWFDHPAIAKLAFYKTKECLPADKVTFPFTLSESNKLPEKLYVRAEGDFTAEVDSDLIMKFGKADQSETWADTKLKFNIVSKIGDSKYFNAARDYMMETNSRVHVRIFKSGSQQIRITTMRHEATTMGVIETYNRSSKIYGLPGVVAAANDGYDLILNGNFCYFEGGYPGRTWGIANHQMTSRCHGGCVVNSVQNPATSEGGTHSLEQANAEYMSSNGKGTFAITTGIVPLPPTKQYALGGFASNLVGGLYAMHPWFGIAETGATGDRKIYIFTVTQTAPSTSYPLEDLVQRLTTSGQTICVAGDGGSSTAIAYRTEGVNTRVGYAGDKHYPGHYWINTYVGFLSDKPRP